MIEFLATGIASSAKGLRLNRFLHGLGTPAKRELFKNDPLAAFEAAGLSDEERRMVRELDWRAMIRYGAIFFCMEKLGRVKGVSNPEMVANMRVGNMDGYCVGEPWNHRAIIDGIGITAATTQDIWKDHPEKALGTTAEFAKKYPNTCRAVIMAILEAGKWIDAGLQNKLKMAETIAAKSYVNTGVDAINQRILGRYQNGLGKTWDDPRHMKFFDDGAVNFPYLSDGMWFLTQHKRWGLLKDHPDYLGTAKAINQTKLYAEAAGALKISVPKDPMRTSKLMDGVVWDGKDPKKYADSFKIKA